jgi:hypothetical protein
MRAPFQENGMIAQEITKKRHRTEGPEEQVEFMRCRIFTDLVPSMDLVPWALCRLRVRELRELAERNCGDCPWSSSRSDRLDGAFRRAS